MAVVEWLELSRSTFRAKKESITWKRLFLALGILCLILADLVIIGTRGTDRKIDANKFPAPWDRSYAPPPIAEQATVVNGSQSHSPL